MLQQLQCFSCIYLDIACGFDCFYVPVVFSNRVDCGSVEGSHLHELLCPVLFRTALSSSVLLNFSRWSSCRFSDWLPKSLGSLNNCLHRCFLSWKYQHPLFLCQGRWSTDEKLKLVSSRNQITSSAHQIQLRNYDPGQFLKPSQMDMHPLSGQLRVCQQRKSCSWGWCSWPAVGEVCAGGRALLLLKPRTRSWEGTGSQPCICQANPAPFVMQGPSLSHVLPFRKKHLSLSAPLCQYIIIL